MYYLQYLQTYIKRLIDIVNEWKIVRKYLDSYREGIY